MAKSIDYAKLRKVKVEGGFPAAAPMSAYERMPVKKRRSKEQTKRLMWALYERRQATKLTLEQLAHEFDIGYWYAADLLKRAKKIMQQAVRFDPEAQDLHREMRKFSGLGAAALVENLKEAEPRVTVAYLQGIGALVPKSEVTELSPEEEQAATERAAKAINPRLRKGMALGKEDGADAEVEE